MNTRKKFVNIQAAHLSLSHETARTHRKSRSRSAIWDSDLEQGIIFMRSSVKVTEQCLSLLALSNYFDHDVTSWALFYRKIKAKSCCIAMNSYIVFGVLDQD